MTQSVKKIVYGGLLIAIGVILPQLFHIFGQSAGQTFLPMHIPVILAGMLIGPVWGLGVAVIVPILSSLITGMPPVPMLTSSSVRILLPPRKPCQSLRVASFLFSLSNRS